MPNQELRLLIKNELEYLKFKSPKNTYHYRNVYNNFMDEIFNNTLFLPDDCSITNRIYCYVNNITEMPKCQYCNKTLIFRTNCVSYTKYCSRLCVTKGSILNSQNTALKNSNFVFSDDIFKDISAILKINNRGIPVFKKIYENYKGVVDKKIIHLESDNHQEKLFCYINNITKVVGCHYCNNEVKFISFRKGYNKFCCSTCAGKGSIIKRNNTNLKNTGYSNPSLNPDIIMKRFTSKNEILRRSDLKFTNKFNLEFIGDFQGLKGEILIDCKIHGKVRMSIETYLSSASGCYLCALQKSAGETEIENFNIEHDIEFQTQKRFVDCRNIYPLPFDFYLPELNICIEYDGEQHYLPVYGQEQLESTQFHDKIKNNYCFVKGINLIRIPYWDKDNIEEILKEHVINKL